MVGKNIGELQAASTRRLFLFLHLFAPTPFCLPSGLQHAKIFGKKMVGKNIVELQAASTRRHFLLLHLFASTKSANRGIMSKLYEWS
jgi:hypothetical protein